VSKETAAKSRLDVVNEMVHTFEPDGYAAWPERLVVAVHLLTFIDDSAQRSVFNALLMQSIQLYSEYRGEVFVQAGRAVLRQYALEVGH